MRTRPSSGVRRRWPWPSRSEHTPSLAYAHFFAALLAQYRRDVAATHAHAEALMAFATAQGFAHRVAQGRILRGWALAMQGDAAAGVAHIQQGLAALQRYRSQAVPPLFSRLAGGGVWPGGAARGRADGPGRGLDAGGRDRGAVVGGRGVSAPGGLAAPTPAPRCPPGGSLFPAGPRRGPPPAGQGVGAARRAEPELGCGSSRASGHAARQLLAPIYSWFTEGFDTADLQEAKALLDALMTWTVTLYPLSYDALQEPS